MTAHVGRRIGDRFVVEEVLGGGGMGSIYRARDERLDGHVAIKFLKRALQEDAILRERFRREALSLAKLRHPGIVTVLDFGESDGELYTVLELVRGRTLEELRGEQPGALPLLRAAPIFDQIASALAICHENDVVHRDLKPSNIMVSTERGVDHVTIIDFGLARMGTGEVNKLTETGTVQGTPHYMAPEQCRGEDVFAPADIYSTGVVFYELLAGASPYQGSDAATLMAQHLFVDPPPLREVAPLVSAGVASVIHDALAKRPEDRLTARELRSALASAFKGTDPETLAEVAKEERRRASGLDRGQRAITRPVIATQARPAHATVVVWMKNDDRSAALRGCLGTAGLTCTLWTEEAPPERVEADAIVLSAANLSRIAHLRAAAPKIPVVVVDVDGPDETTAAIRAGASDMLLRESPDADLAPKLQRLLRRRR